MQVAIIAGGKGTRLAPLTNVIPKPMVLVNGKPFLEHEITLLKERGISDFVLCVGYLSEVIKDHFGDGKKFGVRIRYSDDGRKPLGVIGSLKKAESLLEDYFFMTYGDAYLRADYSKAMKEFQESGKLGMMFVYENRNKYGRSDVEVRNGLVTNYDKKEQTPSMTYINYGAITLRKESLKLVPIDSVCGEQEFFGQLIKEQQLAAHTIKERFYEIGNRESLEEFQEFISNTT
ncbi:MAG: NTP transferase domain-containing protein [Nitrososphaerota archaeon]|jgi:NDP-sugar pyrophosphorylase family protein|nr:NTP transferase domain-containing protein [Nitrososphaerota archaeon]MDG6923708.1 NTP transferase domain-containing protein [Nitrososphaerota archaeon]